MAYCRTIYVYARSIRNAIDFSTVIKRRDFASYHELLESCIEYFPKAVRQASQATTSYSSAVENFLIAIRQTLRLPTVSSELWYCKVSCSVTKLLQYVLSVQRTMATSAYTLLGYYTISEGNVFHQTRRGHMRTSGRKRYYPPQFKRPSRYAVARVLKDNPP